MSASILGFQPPLLRGIAEALGLATVNSIARQPGTHEVYRISVLYYDGRACNSAATLYSAANAETVFEVAFQRALQRKPLRHRIEDERFETFVKALKSVRFDRMGDQPNLPAYLSTDLWLIERAAGTFSHSVIVAPEEARDDYGKLVNAVRHGLPEALRRVK